MPSKSSKSGYYAVKSGRKIGIYNTWADCEAQTKGYPNARFKKFDTMSGAQDFISVPSSQSYTPIPSSSAPANRQASTSARVPTRTSTASSANSMNKKPEFGIEVHDTTGWDIVYSDGACKGNGKIGSIAGIGVWWGPNDERNIAERCPGDQTNNRAELVAIMRVLETTPISKKPLLIRTDSRYSMSCFKYWINGWEEKGWKTSEGGPVKNAGIIRCISLYLNIRARLGQKVVLEYVKGHSGDTGNDGADLMANRGSTLSILEDRNWEELEADLRKQIEDMNSFNNEFASGSRHSPIGSPDGHRNKIRRLSSQESAVVSSSTSKTSMYTAYPSSLPATPTPSSSQASTVVQASGVKFDDFADCLLDDDDLANDLFD